MGNRVTMWLLVIWTVGMAAAILAAYGGIGGDCSGLVGGAYDACRSDALSRGAVGLLLLGVLWLVVAAPIWFIWNRSRSRS
jgi:hypothetical protein